MRRIRIVVPGGRGTSIAYVGSTERVVSATRHAVTVDNDSNIGTSYQTWSVFIVKFTSGAEFYMLPIDVEYLDYL